jgi:hypothetical protein
MELLRVPPYPLVPVWTVSSANAPYTLYIEDLVDHSVETLEVTSTSSAQVSYTVPIERAQYDRKFFVKIVDDNGHSEIEENLDILRPYIDPKKLGTTASEIQEYSILELIARSVIDNIVSNGFYNTKSILQGVGNNTDYFPVWKETNKILKVYENDVLVYDVDAELNEYTYSLTLDNSAIQRTFADAYNRAESAIVQVPAARGDLGYYGFSGVSFPAGVDYTFILDTGYKAVPADIEQATKMLIEDIKCGNLDYYKRFTKNYQTDQFKVEFSEKLFSGTGNLLVDKILDKYSNTILRPGLI